VAAKVGPQTKLEQWQLFATAALGGVAGDPQTKNAEAAAKFAAECADHMLRLWLDRIERTEMNMKGPLPEDG